VFRVRAVDAAGNMGPAAVHGWDIDLTAPTASFQVGTASTPPVLTRTGSARFLLEADESVRCAFFDRILLSRMPLDPTHVRFKRTCV
jgi:hypothetical protein